MNTVLMVFKSVCISKSSWLCLCSFLYLVLLVTAWLSQMSITDIIVRGEKDLHIPANIMSPNTVTCRKMYNEQEQIGQLPISFKII